MATEVAFLFTGTIFSIANGYASVRLARNAAPSLRLSALELTDLDRIVTSWNVKSTAFIIFIWLIARTSGVLDNYVESDALFYFTALLHAIFAPFIALLVVGSSAFIASFRALCLPDALEEVWPPVESAPRSFEGIRAELLHEERKKAHRSRNVGSGDPSTTGDLVSQQNESFVDRNKELIDLAAKGIGVIAITLCFIGASFEAPSVFFSLAVVIAGVAFAGLAAAHETPMFRRTFSLLLTYNSRSPKEVPLEAYLEYHPRLSLSAWPAMLGGACQLVAVALFISQSHSRPPAAAIYWFPTAIVGLLFLGLAVCMAADGHIRTREWRARYLAAHPTLDPEVNGNRLRFGSSILKELKFF